MTDLEKAMTEDVPKSRPVTEVVVNPQWEVTAFGLDGHNVALLAVHHPRHGLLDFALPWVSMRELGTAIIRLAETHEEQAKAK